MQSFLDWLVNLIGRLIVNHTKPAIADAIDYIPPPLKDTPDVPDVVKLSDRDVLYQTALSFIGKDASPLNLVPKEYACAESVSSVLRKAGFDVGIITGTYTLRDKFLKDKRFKKTNIALPGLIIISATGLGNGVIPNGHVGICLDNGLIASNNSKTGLWDTHLNIPQWKERYGKIGQYPVELFAVTSTA